MLGAIVRGTPKPTFAAHLSLQLKSRDGPTARERQLAGLGVIPKLRFLDMAHASLDPTRYSGGSPSV